MRQWHFGCNPHSWSTLVRTSRSLVAVVIVVLVALCALFSRSTRRPSAVVVNTPTHVRLAADDGDDSNTGEVDLFGNEVTDAVARYRFDATGSLYEVHSPQTEIPKLGSPKS
jgi:hypothetical protein